MKYTLHISSFIQLLWRESKLLVFGYFQSILLLDCSFNSYSYKFHLARCYNLDREPDFQFSLEGNNHPYRGSKDEVESQVELTSREKTLLPPLPSKYR